MKVQDKITINQFIDRHRFETRGIPFAKKMWRDGYNKALEDVRTFINSQRVPDQEKENDPYNKEATGSLNL